MNSEDIRKVAIAAILENTVILIVCFLIIYFTGSLWGLVVLIFMNNVKSKNFKDGTKE